jgi:hypothetical protein
MVGSGETARALSQNTQYSSMSGAERSDNCSQDSVILGIHIRVIVIHSILH